MAKKIQYRSFEELPLTLTVPEVAAVLGISRAGAYTLVKSRGFPAIQIGNRIIVPKEELAAWIKQKATQSEDQPEA